MSRLASCIFGVGVEGDVHRARRGAFGFLRTVCFRLSFALSDCWTFDIGYISFREGSVRFLDVQTQVIRTGP